MGGRNNTSSIVTCIVSHEGVWPLCTLFTNNFIIVLLIFTSELPAQGLWELLFLTCGSKSNNTHTGGIYFSANSQAVC